MKAINLNAFGGVENFSVTTFETPIPQANEVLIQVKSISINPVDTQIRRAVFSMKEFNDDHHRILGWDVAGVISEIGSSVTTFKVGDAVFGMLNFPGVGNAYAEYVTAHVDHVALKPENVSFEEAAAATLAALTAYKAFSLLELDKTKRILIQAAAGGVGHYAVQIAKKSGAYVIGTASKANHEFVKSLGADEVIDYHEPGYPENIKDIDYVLESIGGDNIEKSLKTMKTGGTIICLHSREQDHVEEKAAAKGITGIAIVVNSQDNYIQNIAKYLESGIIRSKISKTYSYDQMALAHTDLESGRTVGKIVLNFN